MGIDDSDSEDESSTVDETENGSDSNDPNESSDPPESDEKQNTGEKSSGSNSPFAFMSDLRNIAANIDPATFNVPNIPEIDTSAIQNLKQPLLAPEVIDALSQPAISPDVLKALNQPAIDPEMLDAMSQPVIDPEVIEALTQPAIEPALLDAIQTFDQSQILKVYKSAAALEQIEQQSSSTEEQGLSPSEAPEPGGFLSDFFNFTTWYLLNTQGLLSNGSIESAEGSVIHDLSASSRL